MQISSFNPTEMMQIIKLQSIDTKVKAHEMAHKIVGGAFAGSIHYDKVKGPDGKEYAVGGDVAIKIQKGKTPQETIKNMQIIKAAALAPANPSPQDLKVAQTADIIKAKEEQKLNNIDFYA